MTSSIELNSLCNKFSHMLSISRKLLIARQYNHDIGLSETWYFQLAAGRPVFNYCPENTRRWPNVRLMLAQRLRRWPNINPTLGQRLVFAGWKPLCSVFIYNDLFLELPVTQLTVIKPDNIKNVHFILSCSISKSLIVRSIRVTEKIIRVNYHQFTISVDSHHLYWYQTQYVESTLV